MLRNSETTRNNSKLNKNDKFAIELNNVTKSEVLRSWHEWYRTFSSSNLQVVLANSSMVHALT